MNKQESIAPFKAVGLVLNTVGTSAGVIDETIRTGGEVITQGLTGVNMVMSQGVAALDIVLKGAVEDLKTDNIVEDAHRKVRVAEAETEAKRILDQLELSQNPSKA